MAGFDNGTQQGGIIAQVKQFGAILRGVGPPVPQAGVVGDLYIDVQTWFLYEKRKTDDTDPWGHYLFVVDVQYRDGLKWFGAYLPTNDVGVNGDYYFLWSGYNNYGVQPSLCGPKASGCWPESGDGPVNVLALAFASFELPVGDTDEGPPTAFGTSWQLIVAGLEDEYILAIPVSQLPGTPVDEVGVMAPPAVIAVNLNPLYTTEDRHAV